MGPNQTVLFSHPWVAQDRGMIRGLCPGPTMRSPESTPVILLLYTNLHTFLSFSVPSRIPRPLFPFISICPACPRWRRLKCGRITPPHLLSWPCVSDLQWSKRPRAATRCNPRWLDPPTPVMCVIRVWPYATFIVFASSSSGYTSGQNLEVLNIIRTSIWNIFKIIQK